MSVEETGGDVLTLDAVARRILQELSAESGVHRSGLALTEGGGRRLRFTASDRTGVAVEWCHVDAYDDVPLTLVVRTGERVAGSLDSLSSLFPDYVRDLAAGPTTALIAAPLIAHGQLLGGLLVLLDDVDALDGSLQGRLIASGVTVGEQLRRAQLRTPREGSALRDEPAPDGVVVADCDVEGDPRAVGTARRFLRTMLREQGFDDDLVDTAVLCLSEVVTNAVIHTGATSEVRICVDRAVVTVTVRDQGSHRGDRPGTGETHLEDDPLRVHGRGLQIVDSLAARWGSELDTVGTTVWFVLETG